MPPSMGRYTPLARIGHGGMADVFLAVARGPVGFNKLAVVKRLRVTHDEAQVQMFLDEARLAARLNHPNIVHTYEVGEIGGNYFIAMEYLEGQSLRQILGKLAERKGGLSEPLAAFIASLALKGLDSAHELKDYDGTPLSVVHRDVSPHNLFVTYSGEVKLLDFGIAKAALNKVNTETGVLKGKVQYMAPEQVAGHAIDRRLDLFALGIVLWEMLARRPLFEGDAVAVMMRIANERCPSVRSARPEVSPELDAVVARALEQSPDDRYPTAAAMRADLDQFLRPHDTATLERELGQLVNELFASTRDAVRARVKAFVENVTDAEHEEGLARASDLPALLGDSDPLLALPSGARRVDKARGEEGSAGRAKRRGPWVVVVIGACVVAAASGAVVAMRKPAPVASAAPAEAAPVPPATGRVHLESAPSGALVELNGHPLDRTPADLVLPVGAQALIVSREGYEAATVSVEVKPGGAETRSVELRAKPIDTAASVADADDKAAAARAAAATRPSSPARPGGGTGRGAAVRGAQGASSAAASGAPRPRIKVLDDNDSP